MQRIKCDTCGMPPNSEAKSVDDDCLRSGDNRFCDGTLIATKDSADFVLVLRSALQRTKFLIDTLISQDVSAPGLTAMQTDIAAILSTATDERVKLHDAAPEMLAMLEKVNDDTQDNQLWDYIDLNAVIKVIRKATI